MRAGGVQHSHPVSSMILAMVGTRCRQTDQRRRSPGRPPSPRGRRALPRTCEGSFLVRDSYGRGQRGASIAAVHENGLAGLAVCSIPTSAHAIASSVLLPASRFLRQRCPAKPVPTSRAHPAQAPMPRTLDADTSDCGGCDLDCVRFFAGPSPTMPAIAADAALVADRLKERHLRILD